MIAWFGSSKAAASLESRPSRRLLLAESGRSEILIFTDPNDCFG